MSFVFWTGKKRLELLSAQLDEDHCKDPLRATLRTRRVAASERPRSCDLLIILRLISFISRPHHRLVFDNKTTFELANTRLSTRPNHTPLRLHCPLSLILPFFSSSRLTLSNKHLLTQRRHHEAAVRSFSSHFSFPFMHSFIHHHRHPRGRRYYTNLN